MTKAEKQAELIRDISGVDPYKCMKCGKCTATCPSYAEMDIKPHQFVSFVIRGEIEALTKSRSLEKCLSCRQTLASRQSFHREAGKHGLIPGKALEKCLSCFACIERCPRSVEPGRLIDAARQLAARERGGGFLTTEEVPEMCDPDTPSQLLVSAYRRYRR